VAREFDAPEIHLGFTYAGSGLVIDDPTAGNREDRRPNTRPGSRAPHAWVKDGMSTLDLFGDGFVLVHFEDSAHLAPFVKAFEDRGIPFRAERLDSPEIAHIYERPFVLVRPDGHVAWRATDLPADAGTIADTVRGGAR